MNKIQWTGTNRNTGAYYQKKYLQASLNRNIQFFGK